MLFCYAVGRAKSSNWACANLLLNPAGPLFSSDSTVRSFSIFSVSFVFCVIMFSVGAIRQLPVRAGQGSRLFGANHRLSLQAHIQVSLRGNVIQSHCISTLPSSLVLARLPTRSVVSNDMFPFGSDCSVAEMQSSKPNGIQLQGYQDLLRTRGGQRQRPPAIRKTRIPKSRPSSSPLVGASV